MFAVSPTESISIVATICVHMARSPTAITGCIFTAPGHSLIRGKRRHRVAIADVSEVGGLEETLVAADDDLEDPEAFAARIFN